MTGLKYFGHGTSVISKVLSDAIVKIAQRPKKRYKCPRQVNKRSYCACRCVASGAPNGAFIFLDVHFGTDSPRSKLGT